MKPEQKINVLSLYQPFLSILQHALFFDPDTFVKSSHYVFSKKFLVACKLSKRIVADPSLSLGQIYGYLGKQTRKPNSCTYICVVGVARNYSFFSYFDSNIDYESNICLNWIY